MLERVLVVAATAAGDPDGEDLARREVLIEVVDDLQVLLVVLEGGRHDASEDAEEAGVFVGEFDKHSAHAEAVDALHDALHDSADVLGFEELSVSLQQQRLLEGVAR